VYNASGAAGQFEVVKRAHGQVEQSDDDPQSERVIRPVAVTDQSICMSLYEGLSLALSTFGTMVTVYLGFRQLRPAVPVPAQALSSEPPSHLPPPTHGPGHGYALGPAAGTATSPSNAPSAPAPATVYGRAPVAPFPASVPTYGGPTTYGAPPAVLPGMPARRVRPTSVRAASILLFVTAALQPVTMLAYYGIEFAINADAAATDLSGSGVSDVTIFGVVAVLCGILGILVARGNRVAVWLVWVFGVLGVPFVALTIVGFLLILLDPNAEQSPVGLLVVVVVYLVIASLALSASAGLLLNSKARDFFFKKL
jgi:hypothetical protein